MNEHDLTQLLADLGRSVLRPGVLWQLLALLCCLAGAALLSRLMLQHPRSSNLDDHSPQALGVGGLERLAFPLSGLLLVALAKAVLKVVIPVNLISLAIPLLVSMAVIRIGVFGLRHAFARAAWLGAFEKLLAGIVWLFVAAHILGWLPEVIDGLEAISVPIGKQRLSLWMIFQGITTVLLTLLVAFWLAGLIEERLQTADTLDVNLRIVFGRIAKAVLGTLAVMIALPLVGIDLTALSVFGGALGVGLGFGMQKIAANYVSGFILLLDRSIRIGNMVTIGQEHGVITQITSRYTVLHALNGMEIIVPNETLISSVVQNETYTDSKMRVILPIQVSYRSDIEQVLELMLNAARSQPSVLEVPPPEAFLANFGDNGINLELSFWIDTPQKGTLHVRSDVNRELWRSFQAANIEIPYPQREVRIRS
jgi:small-conductance mechanosensitive channel